MKKSIDNNKIQYAGFQVRSLANLIDIILIGILFLPLFSIISNIVFGNIMPADVINQIGQEITQYKELHPGEVVDSMKFINSNPEFNEYFYKQHGLVKVIINQFAQFIILCIVYFYFWMKNQGTPGKKWLSLKIVDETTLAKPSKKQLLIRLFGYIISVLPVFLGIVWIAFDRKKQGWHDKLAKTLVIKQK